MYVRLMFLAGLLFKRTFEQHSSPAAYLHPCMFSSLIVFQVPVDIIVTPTQVIYTNTKLPKPTGCVRACLEWYYHNSNTYTPPPPTHTQQHLLGAPVPTKAREHPRAAAAQGEDRAGDWAGGFKLSMALFLFAPTDVNPFRPSTQPITKNTETPLRPRRGAAPRGAPRQRPAAARAGAEGAIVICCGVVRTPGTH